MGDARPATPPTATTSSSSHPSKPPLTPEQVRRLEESRLKAKALRTQSENASNNSSLAGQKRPYNATFTASERTVRDARRSSATPGGASATPAAGNAADAPKKPLDDIVTARKFAKYIDYDFSKMTDTKGGFLAAEDDPHNKALHSRTPAEEDTKPAHMTLAEWERHRLLKRLRETRAGPFEPGLSSLTNRDPKADGCRECASLEIDWQWLDVFGVRVCAACKDRLPEKYSLLTKTEAREDYLLTDPELKDPDLLPRLERPNPHKATWNNMQLYLRFQVEEYAFSDKKWGSGDALDAEFARREKDKKRRKEEKFREKLKDLKKRTRVDAYKRGRAGEDGGNFGDRIGGQGDRHEHEWGRALERPDGTTVKRCVECDMEVEELEF